MFGGTGNNAYICTQERVMKKINTDYVLQDKDVKQVKEENATGENKKKDVDISIFMTTNNQKPKRSIADMILGRNKPAKNEKN